MSHSLFRCWHLSFILSHNLCAAIRNDFFYSHFPCLVLACLCECVSVVPALAHSQACLQWICSGVKSAQRRRPCSGFCCRSSASHSNNNCLPAAAMQMIWNGQANINRSTVRSCLSVRWIAMKCWLFFFAPRSFASCDGDTRTRCFSTTAHTTSLILSQYFTKSNIFFSLSFSCSESANGKMSRYWSLCVRQQPSQL